MDQNFNGFGPFGQNNSQQGQGNVPPPPPTQDVMGIRTMQSDMESIQQSGGSAPQSTVFTPNNAYQQSSQDQFANYQQQNAGAYPSQDSTAASQQVPSYTDPMQQGAPQYAAPVGEEVTPKKSFSIKSLLIIIGVVILAVGVGYGVYYLVSSLNAPSTSVVPNVENNLPLQSPVESPLVSPAANQEGGVVIQPSSAPITHTSLFVNAASADQVVVTSTAPSDVRAAMLAVSQKEKILASSIKDITFLNGSAQPVSADVVLSAYVPSVGTSLASILEQDFTTWLYGDKTGGNKLGFIFPLREGTAANQVMSVMALVEANPQELSNLFFSSVTVPSSPSFTEAPIGTVVVRYLSFSTKNQQVVEYTVASVGGKNYLVLATSYNQMKDVITRLSLGPATSTTSAANPTPATSTSTATTTQ